MESSTSMLCSLMTKFDLSLNLSTISLSLSISLSLLSFVDPAPPAAARNGARPVVRGDCIFRDYFPSCLFHSFFFYSFFL